MEHIKYPPMHIFVEGKNVWKHVPALCGNDKEASMNLTAYASKPRPDHEYCSKCEKKAKSLIKKDVKGGKNRK